MYNNINFLQTKKENKYVYISNAEGSHKSEVFKLKQGPATYRLHTVTTVVFLYEKAEPNGINIQKYLFAHFKYNEYTLGENKQVSNHYTCLYLALLFDDITYKETIK